MRTCLAGYCVGVCLLGLVQQLPVPLLAIGCGAGILGCVLLGYRFWFAGCLCLGVVWGSVSNVYELSKRLPDCVAGQTLNVELRVVVEPTPLLTAAGESVGLRFVGLISEVSGSVCADLTGRRVRLSWRNAPVMSSGETWQLSIVARSPWGYKNPGGFDYERWLHGQRLSGTGYVKTGRILISNPATTVNGTSLRSRLLASLLGMNLANVGVLRALTMGDSSGLSRGDWDLFRSTGTVHLMVISGLHIGLAGGFGFFAGRWFARIVPWCLLWAPATWWACSFGVLASCFYVVFSGSGLPAVRALLMVATGAVAIGLARKTRLSSIFLIALAAILCWEPLAVHQQGFWLSFIAVATLLRFFNCRYDRRGRVFSFFLAQWCLLLGLTPAVAVTLGQISWVGPLANMLVLPLVSFCVIPAALSGVGLTLFAPEIGKWCFVVADWFIGWTILLLEWISGGPLAVPLAQVGYVDSWIVVCIGACAWILLGGCPWRQFLCVAVVWSCWIWPVATGIEEGEFRLIALDVGQGSAILVDTKDHRLLFDTGPRYTSGFDLGQAVVVPSLAATGSQKLDVVIISHGDLDHAGGLRSVVDVYPAERIYSSVDIPGAQPCVAGLKWKWNGVEFEIRHPSFEFLKKLRDEQGDTRNNDTSCVLSVSNGKQTVLLTGDIGTAVERYLARQLPVDIILTFAPHHGSRTSSSMPFVRLLNPKHVFVSAGRFNRYGHPHPDVVRRYQEVGATVYVTGDSGALVWESVAPHRVVRWRKKEAKYWTQ